MARILAVLLCCFSAVLVAQDGVRPTDNGSITGVLLAQDGRSVANVRVAALLVTDSSAVAESSLLSITQSSADGRYRLENVPPGRYFVIAGFVDAPSYYPGVGNRAGATVVTVAARQAVSGIDFRMAAPVAVRFSGRLIREDALNPGVAPAAASLPQTTIRLTGPGMPALTTTVAADGSFEFRNVRPGTYQVMVTPVVRTGPLVPMSVSLAEDVLDYRLVIPLVVAVSGSLLVDGDGPTPRAQVQFSSGNAVSQTLPFVVPAMTWQLAAGDYRVAVTGLPAGYTVKSVVSGSVDLTRDSLKVSGAGVLPIQVTLAVSSPPPWVRLRGRIVGRALSATTVISMNNPSVVGAVSPVLYLDGTFEVPKALPGAYTVRALNMNSPSNLATTINVGNSNVDDAIISAPSESGNVVSPSAPVSAVRVGGRIAGRARMSPGMSSVQLIRVKSAEILNAPIYLDGSFEFMGVRPGEYSARVIPAIPGAAATSLTVSDRDIDNLLIRVPDTTVVNGRVVVEGGPMPRKLIVSSESGDAVTVVPQDDGRFEISAASAQRLRVLPSSIPSGYSVQAVTEDNEELRITLRAGASTFGVTGRVVGAGTLPDGSRVWLADQAGSHRTLESAIGSDGTFNFQRVPPGTYAARLTGSGIPATLSTAIMTVTDRPVAGVDLTAPFQVRGRLVVSGVVNGGVEAVLRLGLLLRSVTGSIEHVVTLNPQTGGAFSVFLPAGEWHAGNVVGLPGDLVVRSLTYGNVDLLRTPLRALSSEPAELTVVLGPK